MATVNTDEICIPVKTCGEEEAVKDLKKVEDQTKKTTKATEEQGETLVDVAKDYEVFGVSVNSVQEGLKKSIGQIKATTQSLGFLKTAIIATGIGAFVVAVGALATAFQRSKRLQDEFRRSSAAIKATWNIVAGSITSATEALLGFNEQQERLSFGGRAVVAISGILEQFNLVSGGTTAALKAIVTQAEETEQSFIDLEQRTSEYELAIANINRELEANILLSDDQEARQAEFLPAVARTIELFDQLEAATRRRFQNEIDLLNNQIALAKGANDTVRLTELQIQLNNVLIEQADALGGIDGRRSAEVIRFNQGLVEQNQLLNERISIENQGLKEFEKGAGIRINTEAKVATETAKIQSKQTDFSIQSALTNIRVSLAEALARVFGQTGLGGFIAGAVILGAFDRIIARVTSLASAAIPSFGDGGYIGGRLHSQGGTLIEAERGEYIINRRSMQDPQIASIAQALNNFGQSKGLRFQDGGFVPQAQPSFADINNLIQRLPRSVLVTEDLNRVQNRVNVTEQRATI